MGEKGRRWRSSEAEEVAEVMQALVETLPRLVKETISAVISEEAGRRMGKTVGAFYKELVNSGVDPDEALEMAKELMRSLMKLSEGFSKALEAQGWVKPGKKGETGEEKEEEE